MRIGMALVGAGLLLTALPMFPQENPPAKPATPALPEEHARNYALYLKEVAQELSAKFVRPVEPEKLAAAAAKGMYEVAGKPVPAELHDLDKAFAGKDIVAELTRVRQDMGDLAELQGDAGIRAGIEAMTRALDAHSAYCTLDERSRFRRDQPLQVGVGLTLEDRPPPGPMVVKLVALGEGVFTPAQQAGIRPGDELLEIDGRAVQALTVGHAMERLNGLPETEVNVTVRTLPDPPRKLKLARKSYKEECVQGVQRLADGWNHMLDRKQGLALIRLTNLSHGVAAELQEVLAELKKLGLRGLILDLRDCPGGFLDESVAVADLFWGQGLMATIQYRSETQPAKHPAFRTDRFRDFPMVVLIGPETSGGGELIAAALEDFKRAYVAGQRSRGKGSVQELIELGGTHCARLTTGLIIRPGKKNLHRFPDSKRSDDWGVQPDADLELPLSLPLRRQIRLWWHLQATRPTKSREALPLDRPDADPVLALAAEFLRKQLK